MEDETYIWSLITKKFSGEANESELGELEELLRKQPSWQYSYEMLSTWWPLLSQDGMEAEASHSFSRLQELIGPGQREEQLSETVQLAPAPWELSEPPRRVWKAWLIAAAVVTIAVFAGVRLLSKKTPLSAAGIASSQAGRLSEISTRYGSKSKVTLPDGTIVWLNSGSNFTYDNNHFGESDREVTLSGEAFFDVAHDARHPFIIHAGKIDIKVLGTSFDVKSYPEDKTTEATLIHGSIEVTFPDHPEKKVVLTPSQKLIIFNDDRLVLQNLNPLKPEAKKEYKIAPMTVIPSDSTVVETSWVQNKLAFRSETFADLAVQMERWYNIDINFSSSVVKRYRFTGIFANESLDQALKALQITAPFHYKIEKNEVYISKP